MALYCVSGAFRAHFNQYLCCFCVKRQNRLRQHSTATGMMDTSIVNMSMRSSTNYNRASVHLNNVHCPGGGAGIGGGGGFNSNNNLNGMGRTYSHHATRRQSNMQHQHNGSSLMSKESGRLSAGTTMTQSGVILNDKR